VPTTLSRKRARSSEHWYFLHRLEDGRKRPYDSASHLFRKKLYTKRMDPPVNPRIKSGDAGDGFGWRER